MPQPAPAPRSDHHDADHHQHLPLAELVKDDETAADVLADLRKTLADSGAPDDIMQLLDAPGTPSQVLQQLIDTGVISPPEESLAEVLDEWEPLLEPDTDPIEAELCGYEFLAIVRADLAEQSDLPPLLTELVPDLEQHGGETALAMLRVLSVVAPAAAQPAARAAADRLAVTGLPDCRWVSQLGAPKPSRCYGFADEAGQEQLLLTFRYGRTLHALAVLIDHDLGGGVKDVWVGDQVDEIRAAYQKNAAESGATLHEYEPGVAAGIVARALQQAPCPVEPDERQDVDIHLELLRQRVALLPAGPPDEAAG